jgi:mannose-6-phosphate isomerase
MKDFCILKNTVQEYAWGSRTAIAELLGAPSPSARPQAELWMGAHPKAPSEVLVDGQWSRLPAVLERWPLEILGRPVADAYGHTLPFLFKVLAAATPLSIQAHPNLEQAREGFARENKLGIPLDAPNRNYRDAHHKPEIICALTPFWALNGFRAPAAIASRLGEMNSQALSEPVRALAQSPDASGLARFFDTIMTMEDSLQRRAVAEAVAYARDHKGEDRDTGDNPDTSGDPTAGGDQGTRGDPAFAWVLKLDAEYPGDVGVLSPLLLNLVELKPGQAMFLKAGRLHAYLSGVGMELMANSDNVLRGGLTPKHIDVPELLSVLNFDHQQLGVLEPEERGPCERVYNIAAREFELAVIRVANGALYESPQDRSVEIMICTDGSATATNVESRATIELSKGVSVLVPSALRRYTVTGTATLYKASVPR